MFHASNSSTDENPLPQYISSSFHNSSPFLGLNGNQILLHQYYQNQFSTHYLAKNMSFSPNNQDHCDNSLRSFPIKKIPKKRERSCSKILTAQGPRDRRIRLSIAMARKFFDLQELLGFDKPSKTVDWLFTHSKVAIEELTNNWSTCQAHHSNILGATNDEGSETNPKRAKEKEEVPLKELRAKARARARERTIKKIWSKIETSQRSTNLLGKKDIKETEEQFLKNKLLANKEIIEGSEVTRLKIKPSLILGFNPNLYDSSSFNNGNWDISGNIVKSNEIATMTTLTSSSQGLHNSRKPWDSYYSSQI